MKRRLVLAAAAGAAATVLLAGCTASSRPDATGSPSRPTTSPPSTPQVTSAPASATSPPSTPGPASPTAPSTPTVSPSNGPSLPPANEPVTSGAPVPPRSTCRKLTVRVLIGSGAPGYEFAALQFVNDGSATCTLAGVPTVTLLRHGTTVGTVSRPSSSQAPFDVYRLRPGATAESKLKDFSNCNAPLSDTVRVVAPGSVLHTKRPGVLRACRLIVYPLGAPE